MPAIHDGHLVVSLGRANAVALFRLGPQRWSGARLVGLVPTGWYPSSLAVEARTGRLLVANGTPVTETAGGGRGQEPFGQRLARADSSALPGRLASTARLKCWR